MARALVGVADGRTNRPLTPIVRPPPPLRGRFQAGRGYEAGRRSHLFLFFCFKRRNFPSSVEGLDLPRRGLCRVCGCGRCCCGLPANFQEKAGCLLGGAGGRGSVACCDCSGFPGPALPGVGGGLGRGSGLPAGALRAAGGARPRPSSPGPQGCCHVRVQHGMRHLVPAQGPCSGQGL